MNTTMPPNDDGLPHRGGRPSKLTDELFRKFIEMFLAGSFREPACRELGVTYKTFSRWMSRGRREPETIFGEFRLAVGAAEARSQNRMLSRIQAASLEDWKAAAWFLERKYPRRYGPKGGEYGDMKKKAERAEKAMGDLAKVLEAAGIGHELPGQGSE